MVAILRTLGMFVANVFRSRRRLQVENLFLRHQLNIALRGAPHRLRLRGSDRTLLVWMTWLWPSLRRPRSRPLTYCSLCGCHATEFCLTEAARVGQNSLKDGLKVAWRTGDRAEYLGGRR